jgi:hypothetical protein
MLEIEAVTQWPNNYRLQLGSTKETRRRDVHQSIMQTKHSADDN